MNKAKFLKVILPSMLGLVGAPVLIASTVSAAVLTTTNNAKATRSNDQSTYYLYDNQYFNNLEEATKYAIIKNQPISSDFYIGNAQNAVFDQETGRLDISKLRLGDKSRLYPAYKNALGQYTPSYQEAKKSFVNPGLIQYKYDDLNGRLFNSYEEAKESMENNRYATPVTYYDGLNINGNEVKLNPFNKDDINEFKWLALDSLINQPSNNSPLSWSIFTKINLNGTYTYTDQLNRLFDYKYSFLESVDYVVNKILEFKYDILNHMDFEAQIGLEVYNPVQWLWLNKIDYRIENFSFDKNKIKDGNEKISAWTSNNKIYFENLNYSELELFNSFLTKGRFKDIANINVKYSPWDAAEEASVGNF